jgi:hypothetical protein
MLSLVYGVLVQKNLGHKGISPLHALGAALPLLPLLTTMIFLFTGLTYKFNALANLPAVERPDAVAQAVKLISQSWIFGAVGVGIALVLSFLIIRIKKKTG